MATLMTLIFLVKFQEVRGTFTRPRSIETCRLREMHDVLSFACVLRQGFLLTKQLADRSQKEMFRKGE